ncbi:hypothetical protein B0H14DRAFT_2691066 [Mycena olivaceomarginata]|nr:hypothetical protein B0H14DRAFT_2691066 [Mycena olivaceomarginata]
MRLSLVRRPPTPSLWRPTARWTSAQTRMGDASMSSESARKSKSSGYWEQLVRLGRVLYEERGDTYGRARLLGSRMGMGMGHAYDGVRMPCIDPRLAERPQSTGRKDPVLLSLLLVCFAHLTGRAIHHSSIDPRRLHAPPSLPVPLRTSHLRCVVAFPFTGRATRSTMGALVARGIKWKIAYDAYDERRDTALVWWRFVSLYNWLRILDCCLLRSSLI